MFYFRTAYRNSPEITVSKLQTIKSPFDFVDNRPMIQNDATVEDNYQRLMSETIAKFW